MNLRSNSANSPSRRANWRALGLSKEDMDRILSVAPVTDPSR